MHDLARYATLAVLIVAASSDVLLAQCYPSEAEVWADVIRVQGFRWQQMDGVGGSYVRESAATKMHDGDYCEAYVQSEAWVNPGGTPGIATNGKGNPNWASGVKFGNLWGIWTGDTKHWYINLVYPARTDWQWVYIASLHGVYNLGDPPPPTEEEECAAMGGQWNYERRQCEFLNCPLLLDLDGQGFRLTNASDGVMFDLDADGVPDRIGWTDMTSSDAFLVRDRNGNGTIDDGNELFGTATVLSTGLRAPNGFAALADIDENRDGQIDDADAMFATLQLWIDGNHDGISQRNELIALRSAGIRALMLGYETIGRKDNSGNLLKFQGTYRQTKKGVERPRLLVDVFLDRH